MVKFTSYVLPRHLLNSKATPTFSSSFLLHILKKNIIRSVLTYKNQISYKYGLLNILLYNHRNNKPIYMFQFSDNNIELVSNFFFHRVVVPITLPNVIIPIFHFYILEERREVIRIICK